MSIQYTAPGFEPTTSQTLVISHNHYTRAPADSLSNSYSIVIVTKQLLLIKNHRFRLFVDMFSCTALTDR